MGIQALPAHRYAWCSQYLPTGQMVITVGSDEAARKHCVTALLSLLRADSNIPMVINPRDMRTELSEYTTYDLDRLSDFVQYANK